ncbi:testis-expressed protein 38 [Chelonoidis abingdonii]|uniref:testis-expressed protein 38 n=1 Tax=Chelonoidis abingdonii TaxID=106734 RepID=UPI0013F2AA8B|nr:testis-expressed protein 38 [Chelonoidis abingdonii]
MLHKCINRRDPCTKKLILCSCFSGWLPLYFASLGLCYILIFSSMFFFHWKKVVQREQRAKAWVELMRSETFFTNAVVHWANKKAHYGIKAEVCTPESSASPKQNGKSFDRETTTGRDGAFFPSLTGSYKLVFQELPWACSLSSLPPLLHHSTSYPFSAIPSRIVPFSSLPDLVTLGNVRCHLSNGNSACEI